jgi:hypothetical protein
MKKLIPVFASLAFGLSACLNDEDGPKTLEERVTGRLADLQVIQDPNNTNLQWQLDVDTEDEQTLKGDCNYSAYLGDSASVEADSTAGLYTNTQMGSRNASAATLRADGIQLSYDSTVTPYTHYRVDFECEY